MVALVWAPQTQKEYGVSSGVLYLPGSAGIVWNGLVSTNEALPGGNLTPVYFEGRKVAQLESWYDLDLTVNAYTYPVEFNDYAGFSGVRDKQYRKPFGFSYRSGGVSDGLIHLVYNCIAEPIDKEWRSVSNTPNNSLFSWKFGTRPSLLDGTKPTAHVVIDLAKTPAATKTALNNRLYGTSSTNAQLPSFADVLKIYQDNAIFQVTDNLDGTWTARGSNTAVSSVDANTNRLSNSTVVLISDGRYRISTEY